MRDFLPVHPGEILREEFLKPMGITYPQLAKHINAPTITISDICTGKSGISSDTALRLSRYFGTSLEFWTGIQAHYETECSRMKPEDRLQKSHPY